ncbi:TonB-dependent receptor [Caballeronia hypogeia]|uniref:TonB-dependent receptor n=1 Tax=Caballeronia hypogeia TaxID=1777140 RepID=A0A158DQR5_9BURK|nr:TonB-dependent receptor [Caballeronia hypogeia]SAK96843.1 TonB-dependent receptor [Caballeronia hypogeia]
MSFPHCEVVHRRRIFTAARLLFLSALLSPGVSTAARADESDPDAQQQLKPIIVSAQKRPAPEQRTPIAMSVYGNAFLDSTGVSDLKALATVAPDLNYAQVQTVVPVLTIRGISSRDTTEIGDPSVVVVTDGSSNNRPYALSGTLYDLDHISVLRGPQGTLYGRNAVGGIVDIVTAKPSRTLEGYASVDLGNYATRNLEAMVNVPVNDVLQFRVAAISRRHDGYLNNAPQANGDDENTRSGRLTVALQPTSHLRMLFTAQQTTLQGVGPVSLDIPYLCDANGHLSHDKPPFPADPRTFTYATPQSQSVDDTNLRWNVAYDFEGVDFSYTGSYDNLTFRHSADSSPSFLEPVSYRQNEFPKTLNQEVRASSLGDGPWSWQAGVSYFRESSSLYSANESPFDGGVYQPTLAFAYGIRTTSTAAFGQSSYRVTDKIRLTAGLRVTRDEKSRDGEYFFANSNEPPFVYTHVPQDDCGSWSKPTVHLAAEYAPTSAMMNYVRYDTGYKSGGFSSSGSYAPETLQGIEIGTKSLWDSQGVQINASVFDYDYSGQQIAQLVPFADGRVGTRIVNAGRTHIYGADADIRALIDPVGLLTLSVAWLHARFTDFVVDDGSGQNVQLAGNAPPQSPAFTVGLGLEHAWMMAAGPIVGRVDAKFQSGQHFTIYNYADDYQKPYLSADLSATWIPNRKNVELMAYVRNVTNQRVFTAAEEYSFDDSYRYAFAAPRTFGVKATYFW